jgi:hypothetical protein
MVHSCQYLCSELVTVTYEQRPGQIRQALGNLEEISASTAVVLLHKKPRLGASISLSVQGHDLFGVIAARDYDARLGWLTTVNLEAHSQWSPEWFAPQHSLDLWTWSREAATESQATTLGNGWIAEQNLPVDFLSSVA